MRRLPEKSKVSAIHKRIEEEYPSAPPVKDITVTCDGTWSHRGFVSKYGVVLVIHYETGLVVDYELLSKIVPFVRNTKMIRMTGTQHTKMIARKTLKVYK